ncbi:secreted RxLR effector peptide protein, putative [Phytophthora infestans T30-4]|uniref:Secreted RxLR effector peptide protein, putative n=2 Tax=Phytophthora infestans TaxID=4787 RepID=D0MUD7_PHYIT|nr:secreted RxLR effector peptide protein, putative [Phytophthora infestans T30-4]EEY61584.1 secreted RxLR effector peptide protein, putative [Phytophthora infestans T30-4]KAF4040451.1 hypothetical protein GN244_ATG07312 [Phytophthora infestans]KAF4149243.1 hypothetical protein GN958_ATG01554 [Phytophthora infestans]|eukprot:XP_002908501.1 secreted RxLR effector peptide protein, putative [Phytophthora infestans T30-4]
MMRLLGIFFSVVCLVAELASISAHVYSDKAEIAIFSQHEPVALKKTSTSPRLLRSTTNEVKQNIVSGEERATTSSISRFGDEVLIKLMKKVSMNPTSVFNRLHFGEATTKFTSSSKAFIDWLQYANKFMATKGTEQFSTHHLFNLLWHSRQSNEDLINLFQTLSRVEGMKNLANTLQLYMFRAAKSSHKMMNTVWLQALETPSEVFTTLHLADNVSDDLYRPELIAWLRYSCDYSNDVKKTLSAKETLNLLMKEPHHKETDFGVLFQSLAMDKAVRTDTGVAQLLEKLQSRLFKNWINAKITPDKPGVMIASPVTENWRPVLTLLVTEPRYILLEA